MIDFAALLSRVPDDPYPTYDIVREAGPMLWVDPIQRWIVTGREEAGEVLRHERFSSDRTRWDGYRLPPGLERPPGGMFVMDPPDHTRLRALVQQAFTPRMVEELRPRVVRRVSELLDRGAEQGDIDLMADFAGPLPATVLAEMLGIPAADHETFRHWTTVLIATVDPVSHHLTSQADEGARVRAAMEAYLGDVIAERRRTPRADLISDLIRVEEAGDRLGTDELMEMCILLTVAGLETTTNLIGNGVNALLDHPDETARLRDEPGTIGTAVEELLRYDAPIQLSGRIPMEDLELGGHQLRKGQMVGVILGAANRDPRAFPEPHRLVLDRRPNNHLAFGRGIHFCLGAPLARMEGAIAISALVDRFPKLRRSGEPVRRLNPHVRGFATLPVALA
jgi:cytochrome P450